MTDHDVLGPAGVQEALAAVVGPGYAVRNGNRWDVSPATARDIEAILRLARDIRLTVIPDRGTAPGAGDPAEIRLRWDRMNRVVRVDDVAGYAVVEPGVTGAGLGAYLAAHHPRWTHYLTRSPDDRPVVRTALDSGPNAIATLHGGTEEMIQGLEVVTGEGISRIGAGCLADGWFSNAPLPDLRGLFVNWGGVTGIVTRLSLRLYRKPAHEDFAVCILKNPEGLPGILSRIVHRETTDLLHVIGKERPAYMKGAAVLGLHFSGPTPAVMDFKRRGYRSLFQGEPGVMYKDRLPGEMRRAILSAGVPGASRSLGCLFTAGTLVPVWKEAIRILTSHGLTYRLDIAVEDHGHRLAGEIEFGPGKDTGVTDADTATATTALIDMITARGGMVRDAGKLYPDVPAGDPVLAALIRDIRGIMDHHGLFSPGN